jgi:hypothetical protein
MEVTRLVPPLDPNEDLSQSGHGGEQIIFLLTCFTQAYKIHLLQHTLIAYPPLFFSSSFFPFYFQ